MKAKCLKCEYDWEARVESPKECPRCKTRMDFNEIKVMGVN